MFKKFERILVVVGAVVGLLSLVLAYEQLKHDKGGNLEVLFNSKPVSGNSGTRSIVICLDDAAASVSDLQFTPSFNNISKYPVRDFSLQHSVSSNGVEVSANGFYSKVHYNGNTDVYSYNQDKLPSFSMTPYPFENISILKNDAACNITTRASFDGADAPYEYETKLYFMVIPRTREDFEMWKRKCNERLSRSQLPPETDVYYRTSDGFAYSILVNIDKTPEPIAAIATENKIKRNKKTQPKTVAASTTAPTAPKNGLIVPNKSEPTPAGKQEPAESTHLDHGPITIESFSFSQRDSIFNINIKPIKEAIGAVVRIISADGKRQYAQYVSFNKYVTNYSFKVYWNRFANNSDIESPLEVSRAEIIYQDSIPQELTMTTEIDSDGQVYTKVSAEKNLIVRFKGWHLPIRQKPSYVTVNEDLSKYDHYTTFTLPQLDNENANNKSVIERFGGWMDFLGILLSVIILPCCLIGMLYMLFTERKNKRELWGNLGYTVLYLAMSIIAIWVFWSKLNG